MVISPSVNGGHNTQRHEQAQTQTQGIDTQTHTYRHRHAHRDTRTETHTHRHRQTRSRVPSASSFHKYQADVPDLFLDILLRSVTLKRLDNLLFVWGKHPSAMHGLVTMLWIVYRIGHNCMLELSILGFWSQCPRLVLEGFTTFMNCFSDFGHKVMDGLFAFASLASQLLHVLGYLGDMHTTNRLRNTVVRLPTKTKMNTWLGIPPKLTSDGPMKIGCDDRPRPRKIARTRSRPCWSAKSVLRFQNCLAFIPSSVAF